MAADAFKFPTEEECRLNYEAKGKPLFTRIWSYEELQTVERPGRPAAQRPKKDLETPANWPKDTVIDTTSKWVFWLPEGWQQGIRTSLAGKILKCYFTPEGKRFWHKKDIEKYLGYALPTVEPPAKEEGSDKARPRTRYVTDPDSIPGWPEDEDDWLPKDFKLAFRQLPSGLHRIFIPPGKEEEGFLYHKSAVIEYVSGEKTTLSSFGNSRPMAEISAAAAERGSGTPRKSRKHSRVRHAGPEDYERYPSLVAHLVPTSSGSAVSSDSAPPAELEKVGGEVLSLLAARGFPAGTNLLIIFVRSSDSSSNPLAKELGGLYFQMANSFNDRPSYQSVYLVRSRLACRGLYVFWSRSRGCWQIGALDEDNDGFATLDEDCPTPAQGSQPWKLLKETFWGTQGAQEHAA